MYNIHSHPRSGTHYFLAVLNSNFLHQPSQAVVKWGHLREDSQGRTVMAYPLHGLPEMSFKENGLRHFYIHRDFEGVANSILRMPRRFCIPKEGLTVEEFARTPWGDLYVEGTRWAWQIDGVKKGGNTSAFGAARPPLDMTPYDYWKHHIACWTDFAASRTDVYVVKYEDLISSPASFQKSVSRVAAWLGKEKQEFVDVKEKIGGQPL